MGPSQGMLAPSRITMDTSFDPEPQSSQAWILTAREPRGTVIQGLEIGSHLLKGSRHIHFLMVTT